MKKIIFVLLLIVLSNEASAEWIKINSFHIPSETYGNSASHDVVVYYDKASRKGDGHLYKAKVLWDYIDPQMGLDEVKKRIYFFSSSSVIFTVDCDNQNFKLSDMLFYDQHMGKDVALDYQPPEGLNATEWMKIRPQAMAGFTADEICSLTQWRNS